MAGGLHRWTVCPFPHFPHTSSPSEVPNPGARTLGRGPFSRVVGKLWKGVGSGHLWSLCWEEGGTQAAPLCSLEPLGVNHSPSQCQDQARAGATGLGGCTPHFPHISSGAPDIGEQTSGVDEDSPPELMASASSWSTPSTGRWTWLLAQNL